MQSIHFLFLLLFLFTSTPDRSPEAAPADVHQYSADSTVAQGVQLVEPAKGAQGLGSYTLTDSDGYQQTLEITKAVNGKVTEFELDFLTFRWNEDKYEAVWDGPDYDYTFYDNGDGTYAYKSDFSGGLPSSGTAAPN